MPFVILALSFVLTCVITNYGYNQDSSTIQFLGAIPFVGTMFGLVVYFLIRNK